MLFFYFFFHLKKLFFQVIILSHLPRMFKYINYELFFVFFLKITSECKRKKVLAKGIWRCDIFSFSQIFKFFFLILFFFFFFTLTSCQFFFIYIQVHNLTNYYNGNDVN
ncbi:hypothetical protein CROQUDRAFT_304131 [Cronartium quercuum f. sp. fusiforme G11]|uniref:Transmembrane protein n=1 Tax=Cronartium quercuum f. sp. fusiforme G11 TaxID=708437 RepID=A0A9P6TEK7_9BASI|nr:hypothetical protein CROQUDRAFT_304131 [Cronartium quercuum f. sp. fusiforme G11]